MRGKGIFITIEGIEGVGKSTAMKCIAHYAASVNKSIILTREPGGTEIAEAIRKILLDHHEEPMFPDTELLLMFASRAQHIARVILPALNADKIVLSDRFTDATYAYQGGGRGIDPKRIAILEEWVQQGLQPDITLLLDAPIEVGLQRILSRGQKDRIEQEKIDFFHDIRESYLARAKQNAMRFKIINATLPLDQVEHQIREVLAAFFKSQ
jgi:dTMP kinase